MKDDEIKLTKRQEELLIKMYRLGRELSGEEMTEQEKDDMSVLVEHGYAEHANAEPTTEEYAMTAPACRCSLCHAPLAGDTPVELTFHGNVCEGVKRWWSFSGSPKARHWLEYKADVDRINGKAYRSRLALQALQSKERQ